MLTVRTIPNGHNFKPLLPCAAYWPHTVDIRTILPIIRNFIGDISPLEEKDNNLVCDPVMLKTSPFGTCSVVGREGSRTPSM